ncbi:MAG: hypothetical protein AAF602_02735 [Myxococcota bacterium]
MPRSFVETLNTPLGPRTWGQVIEGLRDDPSLADELTRRILRRGDHAVFFETSPVRGDARDRPFEFVVVPAHGMDDRTADPQTFEDHFTTTDDPVVVFPNLSRTALLVVPRPNQSSDPYGHLAAFLRAAPEPLIQAFWRRAAQAVMHWLDTRPTRPVWFSTAGWGVAWLHMRLDETPKYYRHEPFRTAPTAPGPPDVLGLEPEALLQDDPAE